MDDPNITMEEYIRLEEEKARKRAIAFNDEVSSEKTLSCEPTVSSLNDEIDFRISFDDSDNEDYMELIVSSRRMMKSNTRTVLYFRMIRMIVEAKDLRHSVDIRLSRRLQYTNVDIANFQDEIRLRYVQEGVSQGASIQILGDLLDLMAGWVECYDAYEHRMLRAVESLFLAAGGGLS
ncbi:hypothetical protein Tco_1554430 [Tanacetum coccineum]